MDNYSIFIYLCLFEVLLNLFLYFNEVFVSKYYLKKRIYCRCMKKMKKYNCFSISKNLFFPILEISIHFYLKLFHISCHCNEIIPVEFK